MTRKSATIRNRTARRGCIHPTDGVGSAVLRSEPTVAVITPAAEGKQPETRRYLPPRTRADLQGAGPAYGGRIWIGLGPSKQRGLELKGTRGGILMADVRCTHCDQRNLMWHQKPNGSWVLVVVHTCQGGPMRPAPPHPQSTARAVDK